MAFVAAGLYLPTLPLCHTYHSFCDPRPSSHSLISATFLARGPQLAYVWFMTSVPADICNVPLATALGETPLNDYLRLGDLVHLPRTCKKVSNIVNPHELFCHELWHELFSHRCGHPCPGGHVIMPTAQGRGAKANPKEQAKEQAKANPLTHQHGCGDD